MGESNRFSSAPTERFTERVENYVKARPGYPAEIARLLSEHCGLAKASTLVDVGCGTGLLAKVFCDFGCRVIGVEPNHAMREAGQQYLAEYPNFEMRDGAAEAIPVEPHLADFVTAGQAFHWFNRPKSRAEFKRILKTGGWAVLIWNDREFRGSKFAEGYESLLQKFGTDYAEVHQRGKATVESFEEFFGGPNFGKASFPNLQSLDYDGLVARVLSASYMPEPGHANNAAMMKEVQRLFWDNAVNGHVAMKYTTSVIYGRIV